MIRCTACVLKILIPYILYLEHPSARVWPLLSEVPFAASEPEEILQVHNKGTGFIQVHADSRKNMSDVDRKSHAPFQGQPPAYLILLAPKMCQCYSV